MSAEDQKLISDHKEVIDRIRLYKNINLINTSGEPADEYDLEYKVRGYTIGSDGSIKVSKRHRIMIKLPFGYPHFPPTIKPLSPIFHPEIDDYVVPIANYWEGNKSLADLIIHIGNMICGNVHSEETPFNSKAANYYQKHKDKLPLDSLKLVEVEEKKEKKEKEPIHFSFVAPLLRGLFIITVITLLGGGGLFFFEKTKLDKASDLLQKARGLVKEQEFKKADNIAESILPKLSTIILMQSARNSLEKKIDKFLDSQALQEGLKGNIKYGNKFVDIELVQKLELLDQLSEKARGLQNQGDVNKAIEAYGKALDYASQNKLVRDDDSIERNLIQLKLKLLVAESEEAHNSKNWDWAIKQHKAVIKFIKDNRKYIPDADKQVGKIGYLLLIDQIARYSQVASEAEASGDLASAFKNYNDLIDLIGKSNSKNNPTLKTTLIDTMQKSAVISEKLNVFIKRRWLIENYKEIFQLHYPTILVATLRNPQALFVKYDERNMVFDLSCLEKGAGSVVRLRLFYQYNPDSDSWSPYDGEIQQEGEG